jgi:ATP-independent RNA helicase DbpA
VKLIAEYQGEAVTWADINELEAAPEQTLAAPMMTVCIMGGKKDKLRPGDLLGALTADIGLKKNRSAKSMCPSL